MLQVVEYLQTLPVWADLRDMAVAVHFVEHSEGRWCVWPIFDGLSPIKRTKTIHFFKHDWLNQNVKMPRTQNDVDSLKLILLKGLLLSFSCRKLIAKIPTRWWERPWVQLQAGWPEPWSHVKTRLPRCLPSCSRSRSRDLWGSACCSWPREIQSSGGGSRHNPKRGGAELAELVWWGRLRDLPPIFDDEVDAFEYLELIRLFFLDLLVKYQEYQGCDLVFLRTDCAIM